MTAKTKIFRIVVSFFKNEPKKVHEWFHTKNPLLGGMTPNQMIILGKADRLLKIVEDWQNGNRP